MMHKMAMAAVAMYTFSLVMFCLFRGTLYLYASISFGAYFILMVALDVYLTLTRK